MTDMTLDLAGNGMLAHHARRARRTAQRADARRRARRPPRTSRKPATPAAPRCSRRSASWLERTRRRRAGGAVARGVPALATEFFRDAGWGSLTVGSLHDAVATLDSPDWGEAIAGAGMEHPCCHLSAGMFADFFGRVADAPLAVMEVECRSAGARALPVPPRQRRGDAGRVRGMSQGQRYDDAVAAAA